MLQSESAFFQQREKVWLQLSHSGCLCIEETNKELRGLSGTFGKQFFLFYFFYIQLRETTIKLHIFLEVKLPYMA